MLVELVAYEELLRGSPVDFFLTLPGRSSKLSTHCFPNRFASLTYRKR